MIVMIYNEIMTYIKWLEPSNESVLSTEKSLEDNSLASKLVFSEKLSF